MKAGAFAYVLNEMCSDAGAGCEEEGLDAGLFLVAFVHLRGDGIGISGATEGDGGAAKASSGHAGAEDAAFKANFFGQAHHEIEFIA